MFTYGMQHYNDMLLLQGTEHCHELEVLLLGVPLQLPYYSRGGHQGQVGFAENLW